ncbi:DMT family transporter [Aestuariivivens insulae]|uniref:DMT family transporter n=1 Tax=Aestuariivivens insulae TaxID=1621988 RepID=UPI001F59890B|nr:DMT family transporter [Aestuariivivens insulae]
MKLFSLYTLAFTGGIFLAIQAGFNTQLGFFTKQPILAVVSSSMTSAILGSIFILFLGKGTISMDAIQQVPLHLWFLGGAFSMVGISFYFYTIPKLGISKMITLGLCGQLIFAVIAGKYGWLNLPVEPITIKRLIGICCMIASIILINSK